jgi:activator of HSP90 ATPase
MRGKIPMPMTDAIQQTVEFEVSPKTLYNLYMNSAKHTKATGMPAMVSAKVGGTFRAFGGALSGKNLVVVPGKMIVQVWRSTSFKKSDPDSILIMTFSKTSSGGRVDLVHVNVPEHDHKGVSEGWLKYYWNPWRAYLAAGGR